jgi:carboxymethylenebutenolidase
MTKLDPRIIHLYNNYIHSALPRREFISQLMKITGSAAAVAAVLPLVEPNYAQGQQVPENDRQLQAGYVTYKGVSGEVKAYLARPRKTDNRQGKLPAVLVIHENRGLNQHIEDVARRAALAGFLALAPDGLSCAGGAPADQEAARDLFAKTDPAKIAGDVIAGVPFLASHAESTGKVGSVGFCYGGGVALRCAVEATGLTAAVGFYGRTLSAEDTAKLKVPVMLHYAGNDERINAGIADFRTALDANKVAYSINMYPGTDHGFHNDTSAARYNKAAAELAWNRTMQFFDTYLKA